METQLPHSQDSVTGWALLSFVFLLFLLASCANPFGTQSVTPQPTSPTTGNQLSPTPTPKLTQQYEFTEKDSGRTVTYTVTSRFGLILNQQKYPKEDIQLSCTPQGALGSVTNIPSVSPPLYALRFEGVQPGLCTIKDGNFLFTVKIVALTD